MAIGWSLVPLKLQRYLSMLFFSGEKVSSFHQILKEIHHPQSQPYKAIKQTCALKIILPLAMFHVWILCGWDCFLGAGPCLGAHSIALAQVGEHTLEEWCRRLACWPPPSPSPIILSLAFFFHLRCSSSGPVSPSLEVTVQPHYCSILCSSECASSKKHTS